MDRSQVTIDGNEACASVAYRLSEVVAIYPITPSTPMGEHADAWATAGKPNLWGRVPSIAEMQSEGGVAGAVHGALQAGALTTTFTASQGLLLMLPNLFKIAGELTPAVIHVAARSVATHALSIFGDHSDVMTARGTGWAMLCASTVQEAHDFALIAHAASLDTRIPFLHFFDGFRTSHEIADIETLADDDLRALVDADAIAAHRARRLDPEHPVLRGTAQNPDVFFQSRERTNARYASVADAVEERFRQLQERTGRAYRAFDFHGAPDAERVIVAMGSATGATRDAVDRLVADGERVAVLVVRLYRPFDEERFLATLPETVRAVAVLDRTKEPGAAGEPLYKDVAAALLRRGTAPPRLTGGRYGLSSKEFTPAMAKAVFDDLASDSPHHPFTVGIDDDLTHTSLTVDPDFDTEDDDTTRAVFYGLGSDGTVSANKNSIKIVGALDGMHAQGYFVYDSKKAGAVTVSHLRFGPRPIRASCLVSRASFVACHQFNFLERYDVLATAEPGAVFLLNAPYGPEEVWEHLPAPVQATIRAKGLRLFVVDAVAVAAAADMGQRINTVMQACFFAVSGVLEPDEATARIKEAIRKTYGARGDEIVERNFRAVDGAVEGLHAVAIPADGPEGPALRPTVPADAPAFVRDVTAAMLRHDGESLPVGALPEDGTYPTGTTRWEKRAIAAEIPIWDPDVCIQCAKCAIVCPHAAIRTKVYDAGGLDGAPEGFPNLPSNDPRWKGSRLTIQTAPDDCTGCGLCVEVCPARNKATPRLKAINMEPVEEHRDVERKRWDWFLDLPEADRTAVDPTSVRGSQMLEPLFEFSGACAGCGETPYLKLLSQLFGDRLLIANATGCSSIYGGNLPTTPWTVNADGRGPAWSNSLFEDNAEFGFGMRLGVEQREAEARALLDEAAAAIGDPDLVESLREPPSRDEAAIHERRLQVERLRAALAGSGDGAAARLLDFADALVPRSTWIVGGDGWAYDIGYGGLDHVLASGRNVNVLVLDTEVYSNTGGQMSKATPLGAVAKFAAGGKATAKKDLAMLAMSYGNVYVARIAMGAKDTQSVRALLEAEAWDGPSLVIAYSHCIAHGIAMRRGMVAQRKAVDSGHWQLLRFDPRRADRNLNPLQLDSGPPKIPLRDYVYEEARYRMLTRSRPDAAREFLRQAQDDVHERRRRYEALAAAPADDEGSPA